MCHLLHALALLAACGPDVPVAERALDEDSDGYSSEVDCDDGRNDVNPAAPELCDGIDNDCDGEVDDDAADLATWYADADGDGYGDAEVAATGCEAPAGFVEDGTDCDDAASAVHPGAEEPDCSDPTDYNCDGSVGYADEDRDGTPACEDCDDTDAARSPAATEVCDPADVDEDCSGAADDADAGVDAASRTTWTRDADGDGYGVEGGLTVQQCEAPSGYAAIVGDCDDTDAAVSPAASEVCDAGDVDEDCDGAADDADASVDVDTFATWHRDADGDTFGDATRSVRQCDPPASYVVDASDCDDADAAISPAGTEVCGGADEDCDGLVDMDDPSVSDARTWYADADGDGHGGATTATACDAPTGHVATATDCDDTDAAVSPAAAEVCDPEDVDEDCDGLADDRDPSVTGEGTWYADADGDGHAGATSAAFCDAPDGYHASVTDCDDADDGVHPGAAERCDAVDEDCDGAVDEDALDAPEWHADADGDGFGDTDRALAACEAPDGYVEDDGDCDDADDDTYPGAADRCGDDVDADCAGDDDACPPAEEIGVEAADAVLLAEAGGDRAGHAAQFVEDMDGDGLPDLLIGAQGSDRTGDYAGAAYLVTGPPSGSLDLADADATFLGEALNDLAGYSVLGPGDLDGDGHNDLLVGAYNHHSHWPPPWESSTFQSGAVYLIRGPVTGTMNLSAADAKYIGANTLAGAAGMFIERAGDQDGDGTVDVLIGVPGRDFVALVTEWSSGTHSLYDTAIRIRGEENDGVGYKDAAGVGDVDGDGFEDLLVGAPYRHNGIGYAGSALLLLGPITASVDVFAAEAEIRGTTASAFVGDEVLRFGDGDADGYADLVLGAGLEDHPAADSGLVALFHGPVTGTHRVTDADATIAPGGASEFFGRSVQSAGDIDGDGRTDLLVGAYGTSEWAADGGAVYAFVGPFVGAMDAASARTIWYGPTENRYIFEARYGYDLDGSGTDDLLVLDSYDDTVGTNGGAVRVFYDPW